MNAAPETTDQSVSQPASQPVSLSLFLPIIIESDSMRIIRVYILSPRRLLPIMRLVHTTLHRYFSPTTSPPPLPPLYLSVIVNRERERVHKGWIIQIINRRDIIEKWHRFFLSLSLSFRVFVLVSE